MPARQDLDRHLQRQELLPVYALVSSEHLLLREATDSIRARVLTAAPDFNRDDFRAGETNIERVLDAAATLPMMAPRRWVHLCDIHRLKAKEQAPLIAYLERPCPTTVLCLAGEKIDQRTSLGQKLSRLDCLFILEPPRLTDLPGWLLQRARARKLTLVAEAGHLLVDLLGVDLGGLDMALDKLATYAGVGVAIDVKHVEDLVASTKIDSIFKLTDAIGDRDLERASLQLRSVLSGGENGLLVLTMIARQLRHLVHLQDLQRQRLSPAEIAQRLGVRPFLIGRLTDQAKRYTSAELCRALGAVGRADVRLKSSRLDPGVTLDRLLLEIMPANEGC